MTIQGGNIFSIATSCIENMKKTATKISDTIAKHKLLSKSGLFDRLIPP